MNYNKMVNHKTIARMIACQPKFQEQLAKLTEQKQPNKNYIEVISRYDSLHKIKLKANSKEPAAKWGQPENQTRLKPKGNYGIITGKKNNLIVLDIDVKDDGLDEFNKYLLCHAKPETYTVQTPSGGFHYYLIMIVPTNRTRGWFKDISPEPNIEARVWTSVPLVVMWLGLVLG